MAQSIMDGTLKGCTKHQGVGDCPYCRIEELEAAIIDHKNRTIFSPHGLERKEIDAILYRLVLDEA